ncbi:MAG: hypothetical protein ACUVRZ_08125 [Desulfobacca sp.]|uniref:hypothetical protein n=1 Tax=Desulfobacca sp. TaxID=2067990 RepID=UPI00404B5A68
MLKPAVIATAKPRALLLLLLAGLLLAATGAFSPTAAADAITLPSQTVTPGQVQLTVNVTLPAGYKLNAEAPASLSLSAQDQTVLAVAKNYPANLQAKDFPLTLKVAAKEGKTIIRADFKINFCDEHNGLCFMRDAAVQLPVIVSKTGTQKNLVMEYQVNME